MLDQQKKSLARVGYDENPPTFKSKTNREQMEGVGQEELRAYLDPLLASIY